MRPVKEFLFEVSGGSPSADKKELHKKIMEKIMREESLSENDLQLVDAEIIVRLRRFCQITKDRQIVEDDASTVGNLIDSFRMAHPEMTDITLCHAVWDYVNAYFYLSNNDRRKIAEDLTSELGIC